MYYVLLIRSGDIEMAMTRYYICIKEQCDTVLDALLRTGCKRMLGVSAAMRLFVHWLGITLVLLSHSSLPELQPCLLCLL